MDAGALLAAVIGVVAVIGLMIAIPAMIRDTRRRQARGQGTISGVGSGFDSVWRPSAEDAHAQWEAQIEVPAPAPTPGDKGRMQDGRITIDVAD
ncbi:hypothetical protein GCM10009775_01350 [Microbacterium aoyamense]|uniref:Secreted protein n=1 Tax=Microbacterium aoyamense TaxID=344166 RepID=A0ABN2P5T0_9MICO|nr:hypothetical protein [Microbacterium aoyamense]